MFSSFFKNNTTKNLTKDVCLSLVGGCLIQAMEYIVPNFYVYIISGYALYSLYRDVKKILTPSINGYIPDENCNIVIIKNAYYI